MAVNEITTWACGVLQDTNGRDVSRVLGEAASREGKDIWVIDNYADLPDRVNVPVRKYCKISDEPIKEKFLYENHHPDIVVLMEDVYAKAYNILKGSPEGVTLIVNTNKDFDFILDLMDANPDKGKIKKIAVVDASSIAPGVDRDLMDIEGAEGSSTIGKGVGACLAACVAKVTGVVSLDKVMDVVANKDAAKKAVDALKVKEL